MVTNLGIKIGLGTYEYSFSKGILMGGYMGRKDGSTGTHDPITARALIIDNGQTRLILIEADFIGLDKNRVIKLKQILAQNYQITADQIMIAIIHSHSAPLNINLFSKPSPQVPEMVDEGIIQAVDRAMKSLTPGQIEYLTGDITNVSFNRRDWDPLSAIVNNEVDIFQIKDQNGLLRGILYNYSCHPVVMGPENLELSADWVFFAQQYLRSNLEQKELFVMFMQGTPGNLNPWNVPFNGTTTPKTFKDCQMIGEQVGTQLLTILKNSREKITIDSNSPITLLGITQIVDIPMDDPDKAEFFGEFTEIVQENNVPFVRTVVQALRIGDIAIIGLPGEIFSETGINLKKAKIFPHTFVVGYANDYIGYAGPEKVYLAGGYEMNMMGLSPQEGPILEKTALEVLRKLKE